MKYNASDLNTLTRNISKENFKVLENLLPITDRVNFEINKNMVNSNEGFFEFIGGLSRSVINGFNSIIGVNDDNIERLDKLKKKDLNVYGRDLYDMRHTLLKVVRNVQYTNITYIKIPVMVGLKCNLLEASNSIVTLMKLVNDNLLQSISHADDVVSGIVSNKDYRLESKPIPDNGINGVVDKMYSIMGKVIDPNGRNDTMLLTKVLPNIKSLDDIYYNLLESARGSNVSDLEFLKKRIDVLSSNVVNIETLVKESGMELHKNKLKELGNVLEATAKLVTISVSSIYLLNQSMTMTKMILERLKELL